jgi:uncharacterized protein (TIGR02594 family)
MGAVKPEWLKVAESYIGVKEIGGAEHEPRIVQFLKSVNGNKLTADETNWCSAFVNFVMQKAGFLPAESLAARDWLKWQWGRKISGPALGAIVVLKREGGEGWEGHVGFVAGWDKTRVQVLGGNQGDKVCELWFSQAEVLGYMWPQMLAGIKALGVRMMEERRNIEMMGYLDMSEKALKNEASGAGASPTRTKKILAFFKDQRLWSWVKAIGWLAGGVMSLIPQTKWIGRGVIAVTGLLKDKAGSIFIKQKDGGVVMQKGIQDTKELLQFALATAMKIDESLEDGFQWTDSFALIGAVTKLPAAISGIENIPAELEDLTEEETAELQAVVEELELKSEATELITEQALATGLELWKLIKLIREARKK